MPGDKKVKIAIETTANPAGIDQVRQRLDDLQREANETGQSFDSLAKKEFGNLNTVFDEFNSELQKAQKQLDTLANKGVDVKLAASGLERIKSEISQLRGNVTLDIKDEQARKKAKSLTDGLDVKLKVQDSALDETVKKADRLEGDPIKVRVESSDGGIDETKRKVASIGATPAVVNVATNDATLDETVRKVEKLDQEAVSIKVEADQTELDQLKTKLDSVKDKRPKVGVEIQESLSKLDQIDAKLEAIKTKSAKAIALKSKDKELIGMVNELEALERQLGRVGKSSAAFDMVSKNVVKLRREIEQTAKQRGFTNVDRDAARTGKSADQLSAKLVRLRETMAKLDSKSPKFAGIQREIRSLSGSVTELGNGLSGLAGKASKGLGGVSGKAGIAGAAIGALTGKSALLSSGLGQMAGKASIAGASVGALTGALTLLKQGIAAASSTEDLTVQFQVLLGSINAAESRISELRDFAAKTPFTLKGLAEASRILETITAGALSTGDGLRLVGDLAAGTGEDFSNLALHIGRVYDGLQNGTPVGESMLRLQELGIVSATTRREIEELQKTGAAGADVWARAQQDFARFAGSMQLQSKTLSGIWSTVRDNFTLLLSTLGKPVLSPLTKFLGLLAPVAEGAAVKLRRLFEVFGILDRTAGAAGESVAKAYEKILVAAEKSGKASLEAARASVAEYEGAIDVLTRLGTKVDAVTQGHIDLANALTDAQIAEIEATPDSELSATDKQIKIDELNARRRLKIKDETNAAIERKEQLLAERLAQIERTTLTKKGEREELEEEKAKILEQIDLRLRLGKVVDEANKRIRAFNDDLAHSRFLPGGEHAFLSRFLPGGGKAALVEATRTDQGLRDKAVKKGRELDREISPADLQKNLDSINDALSKSTAEIEGTFKDRKELEKERQRKIEENARQRRITDKLFELENRTEQANIRKRILTKDKTSTQANNAEALKRAQDQSKATEKEGEATLKALAKLAEEEKKKAPKRKFAGVQESAKPDKKTPFQEKLTTLTDSFKDGVDDAELAAIEKFAESTKTSDKTAKALIETLQKVVDEAKANNERVAALEARVAELSGGGESVPALEARQIEAQTQTITAGENFQREAFASGDTKLAENLGKAIDAVRDGATAEEARKLAEVIARAGTDTNAALQTAASVAASQAGALFDVVTTLKNMQGQIDVAKAQIKGVRK